MDALGRLQLEEMAISLDAAIRCLIKGRSTKERDLWRALGEAHHRLCIPGSSSRYFKAILELAYSVNGAAFDPLLPFLQSCDDVWPYSETVGPHDPPIPPGVEATTELLRMAAVEGTMHEYFHPRPEVEQWIAHMAGRFLGILRDHLGPRAEVTDVLFPLCLGTAVAIRHLVGGLVPYFQRVHDKSRRELSFVAHVIAEVRRALLWTVLRDFRLEVISATGQDPLGLEYQDVPMYRVKLYALPSRVQLTNVRRCLEWLAAAQVDLEEVLLTMHEFDQLAPLAASLQPCPFFGPAGPAERTAERVLPFGQLILAWVYGEKDEQTLYYAVDGIAHSGSIAHAGAVLESEAGLEFAPILQPKSRFSLEGVLSCNLDDHGKVFFGGTDRLAPPATVGIYPKAARDVAAVESSCNHVLLQEWEKYPDLFARLDAVGPVWLAWFPGVKVLLVRAECLQKVRALPGWERYLEGDTRAFLDRLRIKSHDPWRSIILEQQGAPVPEPCGGDPRKKWRALIRQRMERNRIPNFRKLLERLAPFGVEETTAGKGSHGTLRLRGREERKQTTWYALRRKVDPLPITFVWECLERLGIGYQDFYHSLTDD